MSYNPSGGGGSSSWASVTGKPTTFPPETPHAISHITGLQSALDGKQASGSYAASSHTHTAANVSDFTEATQDVVGSMVAAAGGSYDDGAGTIALPGGGSDPWTYLKLASDQVTSLATFVDLTGMTFTPAANTDYEVEWVMLVSTATTTVGPRPGAAWGTGYQYGAVDMYTTSSATAETQQHVSMNTAAGTAQAAVGGLPVVNRVYGTCGRAVFRSGATPTAFKLQLASETAATNVTAKAGSFLKYRTI